MDERNLIPELYRKEYNKMVSVLCSRFGLPFMDTALDIVSDTFLSAAESWGLKGVPENPTAWLYKVARNKALNAVKHDRIFQTQIRSDLSHDNAQNASGGQNVDIEIDLSPRNITDSQLQMMFAICHPLVPSEAQVSLALRVLCGFTIDEIATTLLTNKGSNNKRLFRAKERLREGNIQLALPESAEISSRLDTVLVILYLLFNEGYYSASPDKVLRKDFCLEAMRLAYLLTEYGPTSQPRVHALIALMCFQASRFEARISQSGDMIVYEDQDNTLWDTALINQGNAFFVRASAAGEISRYHFEAAIAWWHTHQSNTREKWENILRLYNHLLIFEYSPMAALNRTYAFSRVYGKEGAIAEAEKLQLSGNLFYHSLLGELYGGVDDGMAIHHFKKALELAGTPPERTLLSNRLSLLTGSAGLPG